MLASGTPGRHVPLRAQALPVGFDEPVDLATKPSANDREAGMMPAPRGERLDETVRSGGASLRGGGCGLADEALVDLDEALLRLALFQLLLDLLLEKLVEVGRVE